jgi:hypothetical protein
LINSAIVENDRERVKAGEVRTKFGRLVCNLGAVMA